MRIRVVSLILFLLRINNFVSSASLSNRKYSSQHGSIFQELWELTSEYWEGLGKPILRGFKSSLEEDQTTDAFTARIGRGEQHELAEPNEQVFYAKMNEAVFLETTTRKIEKSITSSREIQTTRRTSQAKTTTSKIMAPLNSTPKMTTPTTTKSNVISSKTLETTRLPALQKTTTKQESTTSTTTTATTYIKEEETTRKKETTTKGSP